MGLRLSFGIGPLRYSAPLTRRRRRRQSDGTGCLIALLVGAVAGGVYGLWLAGAYVLTHPVTLMWGLVGLVAVTITGWLCHRSPGAWTRFWSFIGLVSWMTIVGLIIGGIAMAFKQANQSHDPQPWIGRDGVGHCYNNQFQPLPPDAAEGCQ